MAQVIVLNHQYDANRDTRPKVLKHELLRSWKGRVININPYQSPTPLQNQKKYLAKVAVILAYGGAIVTGILVGGFVVPIFVGGFDSPNEFSQSVLLTVAILLCSVNVGRRVLIVRSDN